VVTPGITELPQAIGIISVPTRKIAPPRALIGVQLDHRSTSAKVETILPGLGAEKAGLKPGDLVLAVNGTPTSGREALIDRLREFREGQTVLLRVKRDDQQLEMSVELKVPKPERGGRDLDRTDIMDRMGTKLSQRAADFELAIQHDTVLQDWQCGGPLANLEGKAIGLNIARAGRVASYALPASIVVRTIQHLQRAPSTNEEESKKIKTSQPLHPAAH
jgi:S1-C subfamily serine protease